MRIVSGTLSWDNGKMSGEAPKTKRNWEEGARAQRAMLDPRTLNPPGNSRDAGAQMNPGGTGSQRMLPCSVLCPAPT